MKDFFSEYWKSAAAGAAGSFLLSLLVGLVTRNPFGVVFGRAILLAVVFAGLGAALQYVVRTHLLDLAKEGADASTGADTRDDKRGERVDIVLPEESPVGSESYRSGMQELRPFGPEESASSLNDGLGDDGMTLSAGLADIPGGLGADDSAMDGLGELAEELVEELPQSAEHVDAESAEHVDAESAGYVDAKSAEYVDADEGTATEAEAGQRWSARAPSGENATRAPGARESGVGGTDVKGSGSRISDDRDGLPDISGLEIAVEADGDKPGARKSARPGGLRPGDALRGAVSAQDPNTIARAIRTVLKRDDKG